MEFQVKYRVGSEIKTVVLSASDEGAAGKAFTSSHQGVSANDIISVLNLSTAYRSDYGAARFVGSIISFVGWIVLLLGLLGVLAGFAGMGMDTLARELGVHPIIIKAISGLVLMFSLLYAVLGLVFAALGQHFRATADTANYNGEMLALMKSSRG